MVSSTPKTSDVDPTWVIAIIGGIGKWGPRSYDQWTRHTGDSEPPRVWYRELFCGCAFLHVADATVAGRPAYLDDLASGVSYVAD
jgi:hypothetical protein